MRIALHVGAHKTATTYMQTALAANLEALNGAGIGYLPLVELRKLLTKSLQRLEPGSFRIEDHLALFFPGGVPADVRGIIVSDENLAGACGQVMTRGSPYATAGERLAKLRALLAGHEISLFFAVRSYDSFAASAYCEIIQNGRFVGFGRFRRQIDWVALSWPRLIGELREAAQPSAVRLWRYEDFSANTERIVRALSFDYEGPLSLAVGGRAARASLSQLTVDLLHEIDERAGREAAGILNRHLKAALPKSDTLPGFQPWPEQKLKELKQRYEADCRLVPAKDWVVRPWRS